MAGTVAPTKSNLMALKASLSFAEDGFDLLEQKRQILVFELMGRLGRAKDIETRIAEETARAFDALKSATLSIGAAGVEMAGAAAQERHDITIEDSMVMGIRLPKLSIGTKPFCAPFGTAGTSSGTDEALFGFSRLVPLLAELAEIENSVIRLAGELRKTQHRCNALSRVFIPGCKRNVDFIGASLEERERENFVILRSVKKRLEKRAKGEYGK